MRIALCGSAGTGKSTLAAALSKELGLPLIGEGMREYLERTGVDLHVLGLEGMRSLVLQLWEERKEAEARASDGFIADRSSFDFAAFWLYYRFAAEDELTERLFEETLDGCRYDHLLVLPWGKFPLLADGVRTADRYVQLHLQLLIEGLLQQPDRQGKKVQWDYLTSVGLEARTREVMERCERRSVLAK